MNKKISSQEVSAVETEEKSISNILFYFIQPIPPMDTGNSQKVQVIQCDCVMIDNEASKVLA